MLRKQYCTEMYIAIIDYILDTFLDETNNFEDYNDGCGLDWDEIENDLNDRAWTADSITGNPSGSYYCNAQTAREALRGAEDVLVEALEEFGDEPESYKRALLDPEYADVTVRCYLLGSVVAEVVEDLREALEDNDDTGATAEQIVRTLAENIA